MRVLTGPKLKLTKLAYSPNGRYLACSGEAASEFSRSPTDPIWDLAGADTPITARRFRPLQMAFSADHQHLLLNVNLKLFERDLAWRWLNVVTGEVSKDEGLREVSAHTMSQDVGVVVTAKPDPEAGVLSLGVIVPKADDWQHIWNHPFQFDPHPANAAVAFGDQYRDGYWKLILNTDATRIYRLYRTGGAESNQTAMLSSAVQMIDATNGSVLGEWRGALPLYGNIALASSRRTVVVLNERSVYVIDTEKPTSEPLKLTAKNRKHFTAAAFSPDGKLLATTSNDTTVTMWDTTTWQPIRQYGWEIGKLRAVAFAPDGLTCAAGSDTGKVVLFDVDG